MWVYQHAHAMPKQCGLLVTNSLSACRVKEARQFLPCQGGEHTRVAAREATLNNRPTWIAMKDKPVHWEITTVGPSERSHYVGDPF